MGNPYKGQREAPAPSASSHAEVPEGTPIDARVPRVVFFVPDVGDLVVSGVDDRVGPVVSEVTPEMRETLIVLSEMVASAIQTGRLA